MRLVSQALALACFVFAAPASATAAATVKVFILSGQSNMVGWAHERTIDHLGDDPKHGALLARLKNGRGGWVERDDVFIHANVDDKRRTGKLSVGYGGGGDEWIGPELMFGIEMGDHFDEPVLLIKAAWGGKDLYCDFRPPSAGEPPYTIPARDEGERDVGAFYRKLVDEVHTALDQVGEEFPKLKRRKLELCGFVWFQGWNEMFAPDEIQDAVYDEYPSNFAHLVEDLRREFDAPGLPVVVGEMGVNGEDANGRIQKLRAAQAKIPEQPALRGSSTLVRTAPYWDTEVDDAFRQREKVSAELYRKLERGVERKLKRELKGKDENQREELIRNRTNEAVRETKEYRAADAKWQTLGSHWECHYHGSGKIYCLIGYGLAEGMIGRLER